MSRKRKIIRQPITVGDKNAHPRFNGSWVGKMLRPGAFFWHAGWLYVGYGELSTFHEGEEPLWDPEPVPLGAVIETCRGYYHFSNVFVEGPPYSRRYAEITARYIYRPNDFGSGFLKKEIDQGKIDIHEKIVLPPDYYLEYQWDGGFGGDEQLLRRKWRDPKEVMPKIYRAADFRKMRLSAEAKKFYKEEIKNPRCIHCLRPESE